MEESKTKQSIMHKGFVVGIISAVCLLAVGIAAVLNLTTSQSFITAFTLEKIDEYSPDQKIVFYKGSEKVENPEIKQISLKDGTVLCDGPPFVVNVLELEGEDSIVVKTNTNEKITIKRQ